MKTTWYFDHVVLPRRRYIQPEWLEMAVLRPDFSQVQRDGRKRYWLFIPEYGKYLRVVTLRDGETIHNAFLDRNFLNFMDFDK